MGEGRPGITHYLKEDLRQLWSQPDQVHAGRYLEGWIERTRAMRLQQLITMANTLSLHRAGVLAYYDLPISTGPLDVSRLRTNARDRTSSFRKSANVLPELDDKRNSIST